MVDDRSPRNLFAAEVAVELDRLVPGAHGALRPHAAPVVAPAQPGAALLINGRNLLLAGPVPLPVLLSVHRYVPDQQTVAHDLASCGWLTIRDDTVTVTAQGQRLVTDVLAIMDEVLTRLWGAPSELLATLEGLVADAEGGPLFEALRAAGHPGEGTTAGRLFTALNAARYHRADAHASAWSSEGFTATTVQQLDPASPTRRRIETITNQLAARLYRDASPRLLAELRALLV